MTKSPFRSFLATSAAVLPLMTTASLVQGGGSASANDVVVVTGSLSRFSVPLAETPQAVTVIPSEQFEGRVVQATLRASF